MVTKRHLTDETNGPPPMDESWWESVLAEEAAQAVVHPAKNSRRLVSAEHADTNHNDLSDTANLDWKKATELYDQDQVIELVVSGCNRGGLLVHGDGLQGFVPVSHLVETPCADADLEKWLQHYIQQTLSLKVIECDQERGRVVFSERAAQSSPGSRKFLLRNLQPGHCVVGVVTNVTDFGVFVDLGGVEGLIHVSEISWGRVHHPTDVLKLGQKVEVYVIQVEQERARVALSLKRMYPNPWETAEERYYPGQITDATVTSIVPFGAFARLEEGLDGLIHVSEFSNAGGPVDISSLLSEGQRIQVKILHVDASRQRLGLSLKLDSDY
jgi:small subunit ribosomal protein S1